MIYETNKIFINTYESEYLSSRMSTLSFIDGIYESLLPIYF